MGKKSKNGVSKGQFGLTSDDAQQLRQIMRAAAEKHGEKIVVSKLGFDTLSAACRAVNKDMTRREFGDMRNAVRDLDGPRVKPTYEEKMAARRGTAMALAAK